MRLWSIHPKYLDSKGLVALWRESLLAQSVLLGHTKGYKNHPQLTRFKSADNPVAAIASYLKPIAEEAEHRGYHFNNSKLLDLSFDAYICVTSGQVDYEFKHLLKKLNARDYVLYQQLNGVVDIDLHPLFKMIPGEIADWEIVNREAIIYP